MSTEARLEFLMYGRLTSFGYSVEPGSTELFYPLASLNEANILSREGTVVALQSASSPCNQPHRLAISLTALLTAPPPCDQPHCLATSPIALQPAPSPCNHSHCLANRPIVLQSAPSPCNQPLHLAISLVALQSAPSPCSRPRHLAVGAITLQLSILSPITRHIPQPSMQPCVGNPYGLNLSWPS